MTRVLVVDDSAVIRKVERRMLQGLGFQVEEAVDGLAALDCCTKEMPDAVLLDWNMPNLDGIGFLRWLRATPGGRAPRVVFCTTETDIDSITEAIKAGADEYIFKPFDLPTIEGKLALAGIAA